MSPRKFGLKAFDDILHTEEETMNVTFNVKVKE